MDHIIYDMVHIMQFISDRRLLGLINFVEILKTDRPRPRIPEPMDYNFLKVNTYFKSLRVIKMI